MWGFGGIQRAGADRSVWLRSKSWRTVAIFPVWGPSPVQPASRHHLFRVEPSPTWQNLNLIWFGVLRCSTLLTHWNPALPNSPNTGGTFSVNSELCSHCILSWKTITVHGPQVSSDWPQHALRFLMSSSRLSTGTKPECTLTWSPQHFPF